MNIYKQHRIIRATLSNDEDSSDETLIEWFMNELVIPRETAEYFVSQRTDYLNGII